jgi:hypothetical protein
MGRQTNGDGSANRASGLGGPAHAQSVFPSIVEDPVARSLVSSASIGRRTDAGWLSSTNRPGTHDVELRICQRVAPSRFTTDASSFVNILNADTGAVLGTATLRTQDLVLQDSESSIRWTIIDAAGRVQVR